MKPSPRRIPPRPRLARLGLAALAAALCLPLASCGADSTDVSARRTRLLERTAEDVKRVLEDALARGRRAVAEAGPAVDAVGEDRGPRFAALDAVLASARVDGLTWNDASGRFDWAGSPVEPKTFPADPPWDATFRQDDVTYHAGPFLRALIVSGGRAGGRGFAEATVVLKDDELGLSETTIEERWAQRHNVKAVRVYPGDSHGTSADGQTLRVAVGAEARGKPGVMTVEVEAPSEMALSEMAAAERNEAEGGALVAATLLAALVLAWLARRTFRSPAGRGLSLAVVALLAREALRLIDMQDRFGGLADAFRATDFGVTGWFGWLTSPGELFLTGVALLVATIGIAHAAAALAPPRRPLGRGLVLGLGVAVAALAAVGWLHLVQTAAINTQIRYFRPGTLLPSIPRVLMLSGLAAATACAYLLAATGIRVAVRGLAPRRDVPVRLAIAVAATIAVVLYCAGEFPWWAPPLVPFAAAFFGRKGVGGLGAGAPSRILLTSVLAVALLFPVLREKSDEGERSDTTFVATWLVSAEELNASQLFNGLEDLRRQPHLVGTLEGVATGQGSLAGLAFYAWDRLNSYHAGYDRNVTVTDANGARRDAFTLTPLFPGRLPTMGRSSSMTLEVSVDTGIELPKRVRSTYAHAKVVGSDGRLLGHVVVVVPDPLLAALEGFRPRLTAAPEGKTLEAIEPEDLTLVLVKNGAVVASSDPTLSRTLGTLPANVEGLKASTWVRGEGEGADREWLAIPAGKRGILLAARPRQGFEDLLLAVARVSIVGVGIGAVLALIALLAGLKGWSPRLQHKILWSYFAVSLVPLLSLGLASWRDAKERHEAGFSERHVNAMRAAREMLEVFGPDVFESASEPTMATWATQIGCDVSLYRHGDLVASSLSGLMDAELLPRRVPADAYRATEIEGRSFYSRPETLAGRTVRVGYAPLRDASGTPFATVAVPLLYDSVRAEQERSETQSVLIAAYLLALVLVLVIGIYVSRSLTRPLESLSEGTKRVAAGEEDVVLPPVGAGEVGGLVEAFNRMTRELKEIRARAAKAERETAWRGMARQIAHEIKNPLTPMKLMLQQLVASAQRDPASIGPLIEPTAKVVLEQIEALKRIADDFSAFARFPPRKVADTDVNEIVSSVATLYGGASARGCSVSLSLADGLPPVHWDADELRRVFVNLVANAIESLDPTSSAGPGSVTILSQRARSPEGKDGVLVTISDTGVGIPPENRVRLFEPDFSTKSSGTGLGLAIVKRILTDLGGTIRIDSTVGRGTVVTVWLPSAGSS